MALIYAGKSAHDLTFPCSAVICSKVNINGGYIRSNKSNKIFALLTLEEFLTLRGLQSIPIMIKNSFITRCPQRSFESGRF